jgi:hypothetical protein
MTWIDKRTEKQFTLSKEELKKRINSTIEMKSNWKKPEEFGQTVFNSSYRADNNVDYDKIFDFLENDPSASGKVIKKPKVSSDNITKNDDKATKHKK